MEVFIVANIGQWFAEPTGDKIMTEVTPKPIMRIAMRFMGRKAPLYGECDRGIQRIFETLCQIVITIT